LREDDKRYRDIRLTKHHSFIISFNAGIRNFDIQYSPIRFSFDISS